MKFRSIIISALAALLVIPSCNKKDDEMESYPYLEGTLNISMPTYLLPSQEITIVPSGAINPTTGNVGYCWYSSWDSTTDTTKTETGPGNGAWTITVPEEIGAYKVNCNAFATDYSTLYASMDFYVVDPTYGVTLKGVSYQTDSVRLEDPRDGGIYYLATAGGKVWTQNNLYYSGSGVSYENSPAVDPLFGRLYTWNEAVNACPEGWHLPSDAEYAALATSLVAGSSFETGKDYENAAGPLMADAYFLGDKMWTFWPEVKITNAAKFSAIPVGYAVDMEGNLRYSGLMDYAVFWTSDSNEDSGIFRYIYVDKNILFCSNGDKESFRASVRCVKD